jgi:hypothetical protein
MSPGVIDPMELVAKGIPESELKAKDFCLSVTGRTAAAERHPKMRP